VIIANAGREYFKFRFDEADLKTGECKSILQNMKDLIPHGAYGRFYFPEKKEWRVHKKRFDDFIFIIAQYKVGVNYFRRMIFKQGEIFQQ